MARAGVHPRCARPLPYSCKGASLSWNSRAFFSKKVRKWERRVALLRGWMDSHDFVALQETHSTHARALAFEGQIPAAECFWSHGTSADGGLGLIVSRAFLSKFSSVRWVVLEAGRVARAV